MEEWRDIKGYEGIYQVSSLGRIKSLSREIKNGKNTTKKSKERILKPRCNTKRRGYYEIGLYKNNKEKRYKVHRLVAEAFMENNFNKSEVNHKNGNKADNSVENLEWVTSEENKKHAWDNNLCNANHRKQKILCNETGEVFNSVIECANNMEIDRSSIFKQLRGKRKTVKGYTFKKI